VIVLNTEFEPLLPTGPDIAPPAPIVIGYVEAETVIPAGAIFGEAGFPDCGFAGLAYSLNPPPPPPPEIPSPPPVVGPEPPPATTR
jgi:hypothetical protein